MKKESQKESEIEDRPTGATDEDRFTTRDLVILITVLSGAFMVALDFFIVLIALPSIQKSLNASSADLQLVIAGYAVANAAALITGGRLGDIYGRRRLFVIGMVAFTFFSLACGLSTSAHALVLCRFLQGLAGALLMPQVLAHLSSNFSGLKRQRAFASYAMAMGVAGISGQLLGGALIEMSAVELGWRMCFFINIPVGIAATVVGHIVLQERVTPSAIDLDIVGMLLVGIGVSSLVWLLTAGREVDSLGVDVGLLLLCAACAAVLWHHQPWLERNDHRPMLSPLLLRRSGFLLGAVIVLVFYSGLASYYFVLGLHLQNTMHLSPLHAGMLFGVLGAAFFVSSMLSPKIQKRVGGNSISWGAAILGSGHFLQLIVFETGLDVWYMLPALAIEGFGIGMVVSPLFARVLLSVPSLSAGVASGVLSTMQSIGNALGVAVIALAYSPAPDQTAPRILQAGFGLSMLCLSLLSAVVCVLASRFTRRVTVAG